MKKYLFVFFVIAFVLSACGASPNDPANLDPSYPSYPNTSNQNEYLPKAEDANLMRADAFVDSTELLILESYPLQFTLSIKGNLPTPCHQLRITASLPDAENKIYVQVYSVVSADQACAQVLSPFAVNHSLGSFPTGHYYLFVNGNPVAEFDA